MDLRSVGRRYGDLLIAAILAVLLTVEVLLWPRADHALPVAAALLATLPLALRRRLPVVALLLVAIGIEALTQLMPGFDNDSFTLMVVFVLTLYSVGRHARRVEAWLAGLVVAGCVVGFLLTDSPPPYDVGDVAFALAFVGGPWAAGLAIRLRRDQERTLTAHNMQLQSEQEEKARQAVAAERARIARELHDVVSHAISVTVLQARGGRRMLGVDDTAVRRALDAIEHTNAQALSDMRRLLSLLRDAEEGAPIDPQPSLSRLDTLVEQLRASGLNVELSVTGPAATVPPGVDLSAYRIIQEALTNVLKHAGPRASVRVDVVRGTESLTITVSDDGRGEINGAARTAGHGLLGIRERVAVVGGRVEAGPDEAGGFVVRAQLPYAVEA